MNPFHALVHAHRRYHSHHHGHHHGHHRGRSEDGAAFVDLIADKLGRRLDLNDEQKSRLENVLSALQRQREQMRRDALLQDIEGLMAGATLDRAAARQAVDTRLAAIQSAMPDLIDALADFYDALDTEQQQALRFVLRVRRRGFGRFGAQ